MNALRDVLMVTGLVWWACVAGLVLIIAAGLVFNRVAFPDEPDLISDMVVGRDEFGNEICFPKTTRRGSSDRGPTGRKPRLAANLSSPGDPSPGSVPTRQPGLDSTTKVSRPLGH